MFSHQNSDIKVVLIYKNTYIRAITLVFNICGIKFSGGNNDLKHVFSPQHFLLSKVIGIIYGLNNNLVTESFINFTRNKEFSIIFHDFTSEDDRFWLIKVKENHKLSLDKVEKQKKEKKWAENSDGGIAENIRVCDYFGIIDKPKFNWNQTRKYHN